MTLYQYDSQMLALDGFYHRPLADIAPASSVNPVEILSIIVRNVPEIIRIRLRES